MHLNALSNPPLFNKGIRTKTLRVMRITAIIILAGCLQVSARGYAQRITLSMKQASLEKVLTEIQKQSGYNFVYAKIELENARPVDLEVHDEDIQQVLSLCFKGQPLAYTIYDDYVIVKRKPATANISVVQPEQQAAGEVQGNVRTETGAPLVGATVTITALHKTSFTDENGYFILRNVPNGHHLVQITFVGYEIFKKEIDILDNSARIDANLKQDINSLDETVVKGYY